MGGGAEVHLHEILRRLVARGHHVTWLASAYPGAPREEVGADGIRYRRRGNWRFANYALPMLLHDELKHRSYDVVVEDINKIPFYTPLHTSLPVLAVVPHLFGTTVFRETNPFFATYVAAWEVPLRWVYRRSLFLAISESTAVDLAARGIARERIVVVECGLDHETYVLDTPPPRGPHPSLIHLGRLRRYKSVDVAIRTVAILRRTFPRIHLDVVGEGPDRPRLEALTRRMGLQENVRFFGHLPRRGVVELLHRSHLSLHPSPKEGWGLTVIEANACGVPVVASRRPGLRDSVRDGETGYLADYGDPLDFARKSLQLLTDPPLWRAFSENAVRWSRHFSWRRAADDTERLLERCRQGGER